MDCSQARAALWPPDRPRLMSSVVEAALAHVERCESCEEYFGQEPTLLDLYDRARTSGAPHDVRARIVTALADEPLPDRTTTDAHPSPSSTIRRLSPLVIALGFTAAWLMMPSKGLPSGDAPNVFVEDYLRRAVGEDHIETDDPGEITRFLQRELGIRADPIRLEGLTISRAEICLLEGKRGAIIIYHERGSRVTHYLVPTADVVIRSPTLSEQQGPIGEMPVVTWATAHVEQALVGEVDAQRLLEIAAVGSLPR